MRLAHDFPEDWEQRIADARDHADHLREEAKYAYTPKRVPAESDPADHMEDPDA